MKERMGRGARPRVRPQMNTDTRRHAEKTTYHRKSKYKEDLLDDEELTGDDQMDEGGVLSDYADHDETGTPEAESGQRRSRRSSGRR